MTLQEAWTEDELAANRRGEFAPSQRARIRRRRRVLLAVAAGTAIAVLGPVGYLLGDSDGGLGPAFVGLVVAITVLTVVMLERMVAAELGSPRVETLTGPLACRRAGNVTTYSIAGRSVRPLYAGLDALVGTTVTAYLLPEANLVIALEPRPGPGQPGRAAPPGPPGRPPEGATGTAQPLDNSRADV